MNATTTTPHGFSQLRDAAAILAVHGYYQVIRHSAAAPAAVRLLDRESFQLAEQFTEASYYEDLRPRLSDLYKSPLNDGGLPEAYQRNRLRSFLRSHYQQHPAAAVSMRDTLNRFALKTFDLGGQYALDALGLEGKFHLEEERIIEQIREASRQETVVGGDNSLIDTTVDELADQLGRHREGGANLSDALPLVSGWVLGRTIIRTAIIVQTESVRHSRWAMLSAFIGNGINGVRFYTAADERVCNLCRPLHGELFEIRGVFNPFGDIPAFATIPIHPRCRCFYDAQTDGWLKPALIWTGFALGAIE